MANTVTMMPKMPMVTVSQPKIAAANTPPKAMMAASPSL
jgi:hypothetical protein